MNAHRNWKKVEYYLHNIYIRYICNRSEVKAITHHHLQAQQCQTSLSTMTTLANNPPTPSSFTTTSIISCYFWVEGINLSDSTILKVTALYFLVVPPRWCQTETHAARSPYPTPITGALQSWQGRELAMVLTLSWAGLCSVAAVGSWNGLKCIGRMKEGKSWLTGAPVTLCPKNIVIALWFRGFMALFLCQYCGRKSMMLICLSFNV